MRRRTFALAASFLIAATAHAQEDRTDDERLTVRAEAGLEYDSNAHRTEIVAGANNPPLVASAVERFVLTAALSDLVAEGHAVTMGATLAGKLFDAPAAADEDVAIAQTWLAWQASLRPGVALTLAGGYYEAFQRAPANLFDAIERRDFRSLAPTLQLTWAVADSVDLSVTGGYRWFVFKPDRDIDFQAPTAAVELRWAQQPEVGADWEASLGAAYERRTFGGPALIGSGAVVGTTCPAAIPPHFACTGPDTRRDDFVTSHVDVTRVGRVLAGGGYAFHLNRSNSYGETVLRHFATARLAAPLPAGLTLAARAELLFAFYREPQIIGQISAGNSFANVESIEDENRSSLRVDLSHDLGERLRLVARYTFYANELANAGAPVSYRRQTMLLSLTGTVDR